MSKPSELISLVEQNLIHKHYNGVQYIAVHSGYGVDPAFQQGLMAELVGPWAERRPAGRRGLGIRCYQVSA